MFLERHLQYLLSGKKNNETLCIVKTSLVAQMVKHLPTMWETRVQSLAQEDLLEKEVATHSSILTSSRGRKSLVGYSPWGSKELDMTE